MNWLEILEWNKDNLEDIRFVGYSYLKQGCYDLALKFFETLAVVDPTNEYDMQTLGSLYLQKGNSLLALEYLDKALSINPNNYLTLLNRTKALFTAGYRRQGLAQAVALQTCPDKKIVDQSKALILAYT